VHGASIGIAHATALWLHAPGGGGGAGGKGYARCCLPARHAMLRRADAEHTQARLLRQLNWCRIRLLLLVRARLPRYLHGCGCRSGPAET
jgi:hypothetical protein